MRACFLLLFFFLPAAGFAEGDALHVAEIKGLRVVHAWAPATEEDHAVVFFEIENQSDSTAKLTGGFAENTTHLHLMAYPAKAGGAAVELPAIEVPAGVEFALEQGGVYLELDGVSFDLVEGEHFEITVFIEPFGALEVDVEIEAADATQHSHAGHAH